jgi:Putative metallopeptidase
MGRINSTRPNDRPAPSGTSLHQSKVIAMKHFFVAALVAVTSLSLVDGPARGQESSNLKNANVATRYTGWKFQALHDRLKKREMLEEISEFLSPLRLKQKLTFEAVSCGQVNSFYDFTTHTVNLCYELMDWIENVAAVSPDKLKQNPAPNTPRRGLLPGVTRAEAIVGAIGGVALHETGHAVFDIQKIPRFGREEDAADMVAGFVMLQFGVDVARVMVKGMFNMTHNWFAENPKITATSLADVHSLNLQRGFAFLCLAYGKEPEAFKDLAQAWLPTNRQQHCASEYHQAENAFRKTLLPDVDPVLLKKVKQMQILRPEDSKL